VVDDNIQTYQKTKEAIKFLENVRAIDDVNRVNDSRSVRAGRGTMRNRRSVARRGPMLVLADGKGVKAFRNIFGLDIANINGLNLLSLAPGGHVGRFIIWTKGAFEKLDKVFGTFTAASEVKKGFLLPAPTLTSSDVSRIMKSEEVRRALRPKKLAPKRASRFRAPTNGLTNRRLRLRLNPFVRKVSRNIQDLHNPKKTHERRKARVARVSKARKNIRKMIKHNTEKKSKPATKGATKVAAKVAPAPKKN